MIAAEVSFAGESLVLLLAEPDWESSVEVEEECSADISTTRLGAEFRRPGRDKAVVGSITYAAALEDEDWQAWRGIQRLVGDRRVVCPVWPDALPAADWATCVHESDLVAGWNEGFAPLLTETPQGIGTGGGTAILNVGFTSSVTVGNVGNLPAREYLAPVCIGRLSLNDDEPLSGDLASVKVEVTHDAAQDVGAGGEIDQEVFSVEWHRVASGVDSIVQSRAGLSAGTDTLQFPITMETLGAYYAVVSGSIGGRVISSRANVGGEAFTFDGSVSDAEVNFALPGDNIVPAYASFVVAEAEAGVALADQSEGLDIGASFVVAETEAGVALADQSEGLDIGASFVVEETLS